MVFANSVYVTIILMLIIFIIVIILPKDKNYLFQTEWKEDAIKKRRRNKRYKDKKSMQARIAYVIALGLAMGTIRHQGIYQSILLDHATIGCILRRKRRVIL